MLTRVQPNILVDATRHARITDFGVATATKNPDSIRTASVGRGNPALWTAPEILSEKGKFSREADVFSFAMVMIEVHHEWVIFVEARLTNTPYHHRDLPARFHSILRHL